MYACDLCGDTDWFVVPGEGAKRCPCVERRKTQAKVERRRELLALIPPEFQGFSLANAKPMTAELSGLPDEKAAMVYRKQTALLDELRVNSDASLFLPGTHGTGKTFIAWLLYRHAVESLRPAVCITLSALLKQFQRWEFDETKTPDVTPEMLRAPGVRWFIGIDEAEKARPSEFAAEKFTELLDAVYAFRHQLVVTSNLPASKLEEHWSREPARLRTNSAQPDVIYDGSVYGGAIIRRIMKLHGLINVPMF